MKTVLIVDDDQFLLDGLSLSLRKAPFALVTAQSAADAVNYLEQYKVDILITDLYLPGMDGTDLLERCYKSWPDMDRVILSGHADAEIALRAINEFKVAKFLMKPCAPKTLLTVIDEILAVREIDQGRNDLIDYAMKAMLGSPESEKELDYDSAVNDRVQELQQSGRLSKRESHVLKHILYGYRVNRIASELHISVHTARNHLKSIFNKLKVHSQQELIDKVIKQSLPDQK